MAYRIDTPGMTLEDDMFDCLVSCQYRVGMAFKASSYADADAVEYRILDEILRDALNDAPVSVSLDDDSEDLSKTGRGKYEASCRYSLSLAIVTDSDDGAYDALNGLDSIVANALAGTPLDAYRIDGSEEFS